MSKYRKALVPLFVVIIITIAVVTLAATLRQQDNRADEKQRAIQKRVHVEDYPIADYESQELIDPQERDKRKARNHRHNLQGITSEDLDRFTLKENSPSISIPLSASHPKTEPAIPIAESNTVVVGEVLGAQAYLSGDKTNVYSEFTVRVGDMLKNSSAGALYPGAQLTAERPGGRVRLPSGKILLLGAPYGKNMPRVGQRYILFLRQNDEGQDYSIITAYELRSGRVFPLDGSPEGDGKSRQFTEYEKYAGIDETIFINDVRAAIEKGGQK
jgi:hypothetical protein